MTYELIPNPLFLSRGLLLDEKFPPDHKIALIFSKSPDRGNYSRAYDDVLIFQNPLIRKEPISNYSSIADLSQYAQHTHGPVDGSLYATIAKAAGTSSGHADNELTVQNIQTIETRLNTPASKNSRILSTILEWDNIRNGENGNGGHHESAYIKSAPPRTRQEQQRSYVKSPLIRSYDSGIYSHEVTNSELDFMLGFNQQCWYSLNQIARSFLCSIRFF